MKFRFFPFERYEFGFHHFSFYGELYDLFSCIHSEIIKSLGKLSQVVGIRFVGNTSLQRKIEQGLIHDIDVHILVDKETLNNILIVSDLLKQSIKNALPIKGNNLASITFIRGAYKPKPRTGRTRLLIHTLFADSIGYLNRNPLVRYSWTKYNPSYGSFAELDRLALMPTLTDVISGKGGILDNLKWVTEKTPRLRIWKFNRKKHEIKQELFNLRKSWLLHELYTSFSINSYRNLCRALGILDVAATNFELVPEKSPQDLHKILTSEEKESLTQLIKSKYDLRSGKLEVISSNNLEILRLESIRFLNSLARRFQK